VSGESTGKAFNPAEFGFLPPLSHAEVKALQSICSSGKAVINDAYSDT
jgi:hypothetical protein